MKQDNLIDALQCFKINTNKIRLGNKYDGGYVIPEIFIDNIDTIYSYGIGDDISFEIDFLTFKDININMYDHTVNGLPLPNNKINFFKEGLSYRKENNLNTFQNHKIENNDLERSILLKIDIEGGEYDYIKYTDINDFKNVNGLIFEFHNLERNINNFLDAMTKLKKEFILIHVHGNNYGKIFIYDEYVIPDALEIIMINKNLVSVYNKNIETYPLENLDYACSEELKDYILDFTNIEIIKSDFKSWTIFLSERSQFLLNKLFQSKYTIEEKDKYIESLKNAIEEKDKYIESFKNKKETND